jgi:putative hydrolase of the HAD superfamily
MYAWSYIVGRDFDSLDLLRAIGVRRGYKLSEEQWQQFAWCWYEPLAKIAKVEPDIRKTLAALRDAGIRLGIVSNTFITRSSLDRHLKELGLLEFFPLRIYSDENPWRKPNIKIFNDGARKIGVEPQNIAFVGDRIDNDVRGAIKAGMIPILKFAYTNQGKSPPSGVLKINLLSELPSLVSLLNKKN